MPEKFMIAVSRGIFVTDQRMNTVCVLHAMLSHQPNKTFYMTVLGTASWIDADCLYEPEG